VSFHLNVLNALMTCTRCHDNAPLIWVGALKITDMKMQNMKLTDRFTEHEIAAYEIAGHKL